MFILILLGLLGCASGANILAMFPVPSYSHQIVYRALTMELNRRGHNLTVITPDPVNNPNLTNYHEIDISFYYEHWNRRFDMASDAAKLLRLFPELFLVAFSDSTHEMCEMYLSDPNVNRLIRENQKFDLFITEFGVSACFYAFSKLSDYKFIGIFSFSHTVIVHSDIGNPASASYLPDPFLPFLDRMSYWERFRTFIFQIASWVNYVYVIWDHTQIARKYFGEDTPYLHHFERNVSVIFTNTHFTTTYPRPLVPNFVDIGGPPFHFHGWKPNPLPKDIQEFLDDAKEGVIYFSLGSNVKSSTMPESKRAVFLEAFKQIKQKVLWKWETDDLPGKPDNVKLGKWLPQTDILAHPKIKLFITQGGLQSMGEATHNVIPMIVIPFFADQELNAKKLVSVGVAIRLDFETMTTEELVSAINEIINNKEYKKNMEKYSALTKDQPQSPMERAIWWTEYVLRHNGARHLRSAAVDMPWYQYFLLDVIAFLLAVALISLYLTYLIVRTIVRLIFGKSKKTKKE